MMALSTITLDYTSGNEIQPKAENSCGRAGTEEVF